MTDIIGIPDPNILASDMASQGHYSCAQAEASGWFVTEHQPTRDAVDALLQQMTGAK